MKFQLFLFFAVLSFCLSNCKLSSSKSDPTQYEAAFSSSYTSKEVSYYRGTLGGQPADLILTAVQQDNYTGYSGRLFAPAFSEDPTAVNGSIDSNGVLVLTILKTQPDNETALTLTAHDDGFRGRILNNGKEIKASFKKIEALHIEPIQLVKKYVEDKKRGDKLPSVEITVDYLHFKDLPALNLLQQKTIFGDQADRDFKKNFDQYAGRLVSEYLNDIAQVEDDFVSPYYYSTNSSIEFINDRFVTLSFNNGAYTGGAHGNYGVVLCTFDRKTEKQIKHSDLFVSGAFEKLTPLLETYYKKQYGLKVDEPLNQTLLVDSIEPTTNCGIVGRGVLFLYSPYEIASYAQGIQEIWLPFEALEGYINKDFVNW